VTLPFAPNGEWSVAVRPPSILCIAQIEPALRAFEPDFGAGQRVLSKTLPRFR
jgi:hypothetical protein